MAHRPQTPSEKIIAGAFALFVGTMAFVCCICVLKTGEWGSRGHSHVVTTPQNNPWGYWGGIVMVNLAGVVAWVAGVKAIIDGLKDDETL